jgi:hypothetical protein
MWDPPSWERNNTEVHSFKNSIEGFSVIAFIKNRSRIKCGMTFGVRRDDVEVEVG